MRWCTPARRLVASITRDTLMRLTFTQGAVSISGSRSITKPGLTPAPTTVTPAPAAARCSSCAAAGSLPNGYTSSSQVEITLARAFRQASSWG